MGLVSRKPGDRRWGLAAEFPLSDSQGNCISQDRRSGFERRRSGGILEKLLVLLARLPANDAGRS